MENIQLGLRSGAGAISSCMDWIHLRFIDLQRPQAAGAPNLPPRPNGINVAPSAPIRNSSSISRSDSTDSSSLAQTNMQRNGSMDYIRYDHNPYFSSQSLPSIAENKHDDPAPVSAGNRSVQASMARLNSFMTILFGEFSVVGGAERKQLEQKRPSPLNIDAGGAEVEMDPTIDGAGVASGEDVHAFVNRDLLTALIALTLDNLVNFPQEIETLWKGM